MFNVDYFIIKPLYSSYLAIFSDCSSLNSTLQIRNPDQSWDLIYSYCTRSY